MIRGRHDHIDRLVRRRECKFVLPASTYQSALLSLPTVSDRFFHEARNMVSMQRVTNAEHAIWHLTAPGPLCLTVCSPRETASFW
jgi:hypothetical protein